MTLTIDVYENGDIRVTPPPPDPRDQQSITITQVQDWVSYAESQGWRVVVNGRSRDPVVASVLALIRSTGTSFTTIDNRPSAPEPVGLVDRFRRSPKPSSGNGFDPKVGERAWRRFRRYGAIEAASEYQRLTGVRSTKSPPDSRNAVVVNLFTARLLYVPVALTVAALAVVALQGGPLSRFLTLLAIGAIFPAAYLLVYGTPRADAVELAFEGSRLWRRRLARGWEGPFDLEQTERLAAQVRNVDRGTTKSVVVLFVSDQFPPTRNYQWPPGVRNWVGDHHHIRLTVMPSPLTRPDTGIVREAIRHVPPGIPTMYGSEEALYKYAVLPPNERDDAITNRK